MRRLGGDALGGDRSAATLMATAATGLAIGSVATGAEARAEATGSRRRPPAHSSSPSPADCGPRLWTVEVLFDGQGRMYLDKGWEKFAIAHGVDFGWFVHFKYEGDDVLTVKVFDGTMCRGLGEALQQIFSTTNTPSCCWDSVKIYHTSAARWNRERKGFIDTVRATEYGSAGLQHGDDRLHQQRD
ncbi:hypothetical protein QYE76_000621 [Lolium multiflorum]|uniref:TF-B3 domain-containing protein n=1 Tax=Lolium multiflorum TaxID=4521 RepID=A0AAD8RM81_LOLMU|nr:hypothetical protein QYE76_000621 [Lolium multiflorum]